MFAICDVYVDATNIVSLGCKTQRTTAAKEFSYNLMMPTALTNCKCLPQLLVELSMDLLWRCLAWLTAASNDLL